MAIDIWHPTSAQIPRSILSAMSWLLCWATAWAKRRKIHWYVMYLGRVVYKSWTTLLPWANPKYLQSKHTRPNEPQDSKDLSDVSSSWLINHTQWTTESCGTPNAINLLVPFFFPFLWLWGWLMALALPQQTIKTLTETSSGLPHRLARIGWLSAQNVYAPKCPDDDNSKSSNTSKNLR